MALHGILDKFLPPADRLSGYERRVAALLVAGALLFLPLTIWLTVRFWRIDGPAAHTTLGPAGVTAGLVIMLACCRAGCARAGGFVALTAGFTMLAMNVAIEGPHSVRLSILPIIIMCASLVLRPWFALLYAGATAVLLLLYDGATGAGMLPTPPGGTSIGAPMRLALSSGLVGWLLGRGFQSMVRELRERQEELTRSNEALAESQARARTSKARYAELVLQSPDGIARLDAQGRIEQPNPALCELLGYDRHALEGLTPVEAGLPDVSPADTDAPAGQTEEHLLARDDERAVWVEVLVRRMAQTGARPRSQLIVRNIDTRKRAEQLEKRLAHAQKLESIGRLAGGVAHGFNNLLTVIAGNTHLLKRRIEDPGIDDTLAAVDRLERMTRQLMAFGQRHHAGVRPVSLNATLAAMEPMLGSVAGDQVEVVFDPAPGPVWAAADPALLDQVILHLVVNAQEAMPDGGTLHISTAEAARTGAGEIPMARLRVRDTGVGIAPETVDRIFEPFFSTKDLSQGAGLGLPTVHGIVTQLGGGVDVASTVGAGTTVDVWLPRADRPDDATAEDTG